MVQSEHQAEEAEGKGAEAETSQNEDVVARRGSRSKRRQLDRAEKLAHDRAIHPSGDR